MALQAIVDNLDDLDKTLHEHYKKDDKSGKYILDLTDFDSAPRVRQLKDEAAQNRIKAREAEKNLEPFKSLGDISKVQAQLDRIPELEAAAEGKLDDKKIDALVEGRIRTKLAPIERERDQLKTQVVEKDRTIGEFTAKEKQRKVHDSVRTAIKKQKGFESHAEEDVLMYADRVFDIDDTGTVVTKDGVGTTPGITPADWLTEMQPKRPHWWGPSAGSGARGSGGGAGGGDNPWTAESWNMTRQGQIYKENPERAKQLAQLAGTKLGGMKPTPKNK